MPQEDLINEAQGYLSSLQHYVDSQVSLRHQNPLTAMEDFYRELLNKVFGWKLRDDNLVGGKQQDSFDLSDRDKRVAVQVTHTTNAKKIEKTLQMFVGKHDADFDRLVFAYSKMKVGKLRKSLAGLHHGFDFQVSRDRLTFLDVLEKIKRLDLDQKVEVVGFIRDSAPQILSTSLISQREFTCLSKTVDDARASAGTTLFERETCVGEILKAKEDCLVTGQPGVGKTAVLSVVLSRSDGWFVKSGNRAELTSELKRVDPMIVAVEDAHGQTELLRTLRSLRQEHSLGFRIVCDCWPMQVDDLRAELHLTAESIHVLGPISNKAVIQMAKDRGISGPDRFFHHLVRQSMGFPGRAAMLLQCCESGDQADIQDFFTGESMARWIKRFVLRNSDRESLDVLACLSLGRERGMSLSFVSEYLELSIRRVETIVAGFSASGLIEQSNWGGLVVHPYAIRPILIRDYFFSVPRRSLEFFVKRWQTTSTVAMAAVDAYCVGAKVPIHELFELADRADSHEVWDRLAAAEDDLADMVLDRRPDVFDGSWHTFLDRTPERSIELLIQRKPPPRAPHNNQPEADCQAVESWAKRGYPEEKAVPRRRIVLDAISNQLSHGTSAEQAYRFLPCALSPEYRNTGQSAEDFDTFMLWSGLLPTSDLKELHSFWDHVRDLLMRYPPSDWTGIVDAMKEWLWPSVSGSVNDAQREQLRLSAQTVLPLLAELCKSEPAAVTEVRRLAEYHRVAIEVEVPVEYATLFPSEPVYERSSDSHKTFLTDCYERAVELGVKWSRLPPAEVMEIVRCYELCAKRLGQSYPNFCDVVAMTIARESEQVGGWIDAAFDADVDSIVVLKFLLEAVHRTEPDCEQRLERALTSDKYQGDSICLLLAEIPNLPERLVNQAIMLAPPYAQVLFVSALRNEISPTHYLDLLNHEDEKLRGMIASGIWGQANSAPEKADIYDPWLKAIIMNCNREHVLIEVFAAEPMVKQRWIEHWSKNVESPFRSHREHEVVEAACKDVPVEDRSRLVANVHEEASLRDLLIKHLVGDNTDVFAALLKLENLGEAKLHPLRRMPDQTWERFAAEALDAGFSESDIARASGLGWESEYDTVEDRYRCEIEAWDRIIAQQTGVIQRIARRRRQDRLRSLADMGT
ncbi:MAG: SMEK domain-containing protein [Planctomycetota bacterium]